MIRDDECWTGCGEPGFWVHKLDDRGGSILLCELHHYEHSISHRDPDALELLAKAFELAGASYDAYRFRFYAVGMRKLADA